MKIAIIAFAKTIGLSPVKTRLAKDIGQEKAEIIYQKLVTKIKYLFDNIENSQKHCYFALAEKNGPQNNFWKNYQTIYTEDGNLGDRLNYIYNHFIKKYDLVIIISSDTPQIEKNHIESTINSTSDITIGPAPDGGFYLFSGKETIPAEIWKNVKYSQKDTLKTLEKNLQKENFSLTKLEPLEDIDNLTSYKNLQNFIP